MWKAEGAAKNKTLSYDERLKIFIREKKEF